LAANVYEAMFILDSNKYARDAGGITGQLTKMFTDLGGEILVSRLWNEQKLAYPIKGQRKGTYWLIYCRLDSGKLAEVDRRCRLNENILRNLVVKVEPRLVDVLVEHARAGTTISRAVEAPAKPPPARVPAGVGEDEEIGEVEE
jgi:small subunit ribosomal protein S6